MYSLGRGNVWVVQYYQTLLETTLCRVGGEERIARHNLIRDVLYNACSSAALGPTREDRALLPGTEAKPADILLPGWSGGKDTALDITVVNPLQTQFINQSAAVAGHALRKAYERKMQRIHVRRQG